MQNIVGEAIGESLNHLCFFFLTRNLLEIIYFFSKMNTIKTFLSHLYTVLWLVQLFVSYPVMVKVVFWSWETHVALCIHWVCDGKEEERFNSSNNNVSYFHYIALPVLLGLNFWKHLPSQSLLAQPELLMPTSPTLPQDFSSATDSSALSPQYPGRGAQTRQPLKHNRQ